MGSNHRGAVTLDFVLDRVTRFANGEIDDDIGDIVLNFLNSNVASFSPTGPEEREDEKNGSEREGEGYKEWRTREVKKSRRNKKRVILSEY